MVDATPSEPYSVLSLTGGANLAILDLFFFHGVKTDLLCRAAELFRFQRFYETKPSHCSSRPFIFKEAPPTGNELRFSEVQKFNLRQGNLNRRILFTYTHYWQFTIR